MWEATVLQNNYTLYKGVSYVTISSYTNESSVHFSTFISLSFTVGAPAHESKWALLTECSLQDIWSQCTLVGRDAWQGALAEFDYC
jgi:hypothetical protein